MDKEYVNIYLHKKHQKLTKIGILCINDFYFNIYTHLHSSLTVALILFKRILKNMKIYLINACIEQLVQVAINAKMQIGRNLGKQNV